MSRQLPLVLHVITGLNDGGAEAALYRLCHHDQGHRHHVVSLMDGGKYGPLLRADGIPVHCLSMPRGSITLQGLRQLWALVRHCKPDVMQTWLYHADLIGGLVGRLAGMRRIFWGIHHSNLTPGTVKQSTIRIAKLCAVLSSIVPLRIVSCSNQSVQSHVRMGYARKKFVVIPNGYDLGAFALDPAAGVDFRNRHGVPQHTPVLGMVARFDRQKDHGNLISALAQLKRKGLQFRCVLAGTGMEWTNTTLTALIDAAELRDQVVLVGRQDHIAPLMNALDLHILSSLGEAFPNVLAEAMACGVPCVTTDVGDAALIVGDTGWVVPPQDSGALAAGIETAMASRADVETWAERGCAARRRIEDNFAIQNVSRMYGAVWRNVQV